MAEPSVARVAIVTGGDSGIGAACAIAIAKTGARVVITYHSDEESAAKVCDTIRNGGSDALALKTDVGDEAAVEALFAAAEKRFGTVTLLVNSAGLNMSGTPLTEMSLDHFDRVLKTDLYGCFLTCRRLVRALSDGETARIVNISSIHEFAPRGGGVDYDAAKGGLAQLTRTLALELGPRGIAVNGIAPGMILTPMNEKAVEDPAYRRSLEANIPWRRAGRPEEVADLCVYLLSPAADYITGASIVIDGGLSLMVAQGA